MKTEDNKGTMNTLSSVVNRLSKDGFTENFMAEEKKVKGLYNKNAYNPNELKIVKKYRFEGQSNPSDSTLLLAIVAGDGTKGTITVNYGAESNQNDELIKAIPSDIM